MVLVVFTAWLFLAGGQETLSSLVRPSPPVPAGRADIGYPVPELRLPLAGGGEVDAATYRGRPLLINFWATWCAPCVTEMPAIERAYQRYRAAGLEVLAVDLQESEEQVLGFLRDVKVSYRSALDSQQEVARRFRATALPTTFFVDREGIIRDIRVGPMTDEMLAERLAKIL